MPAWITSLLRDEVTVPTLSAASRMTTSRPACASRRATARPTTPAPITTHSTLSIRCSDPELLASLPCAGPGWFVDSDGHRAPVLSLGLWLCFSCNPLDSFWNSAGPDY